MALLFIDYETRSRVDLPSAGSFVYSRDPSTEILMVGVARDYDPPAVHRHVGMLLTPVVSWGRFDYEIYREKESFVPSRRWIDASAVARYLGLPGGLDACARWLDLPVAKDTRGKRLISKYCKPNKEGDFEHLTGDDRIAMREYAIQDVVLLQEIWKRIGPYYPEWEKNCRAGYEVTHRMNDRGVPIDREAAYEAHLQCLAHEERLRVECRDLSGFNPSQNLKIAEFLGMDSIGKEKLAEATFKDPTQARVAEIRLEFAKAATKKLVPMMAMSTRTGRAHGCFIPNGAHTGRGSSRNIQFQNLKRAKVDPEVFAKLDRGDRLDNPLGDVQQNIRGFLRPGEGKVFVVVDYAQVEARILAWLADDPTLLEMFRTGRDPYKYFAAHLFKVDQSSVTDEQRAYGKIAVLGAGYGAGPGLAVQAKAYGIDMTETEARELAELYRSLFPEVPALWERMFFEWTQPGWLGSVVPKSHDLKQQLRAGFHIPHGAWWTNESLTNDLFGWGGSKAAGDHGKHWGYSYKDNALRLHLPSERIVRYHRPRSDLKFRVSKKTKKIYPSPEVTYTDQFGRRRQLRMTIAVENVCQAIATDLKLDAMCRLDDMGYQLVGEVHDEIIIEVDAAEAEACLRETIAVLESPPDWAPKDLIKAEGSIMPRYSK